MGRHSDYLRVATKTTPSQDRSVLTLYLLDIPLLLILLGAYRSRETQCEPRINPKIIL